MNCIMDFFTNVNWQELLQTYGYWAILVGAFLEGETIVILAGIFVASEQMSFVWVALCAFIGCTLSDQLMFAIGRFKGTAFLARFPRLNRKRRKVSRLLQKYDLYLILGFRFVYGLRNITPIILGSSNVKYWRFLVLNLISALLWVVLFTAAGYYFGEAVNRIMKAFGLSALFLVLGALLVLGVAFFYIRRRRQLQNPTDEEDAE